MPLTMRAMLYSDELKMLARAYCEHTGTSYHGLGLRSGLGGKFFKRLMADEGVHLSSGEKALLWLAENWPVDLPWPRWIYRPPTGEPPANPPDAAHAGEAA